VACTGGEPLLQLDQDLVQAFHGLGYLVAVETNGTLLPSAGIDWICVSPKVGTELKLVFPQENLDPEVYEGSDSDDFLLQPMDILDLEQNMAAAAEYCHVHSGRRVSL
jgi:7-carboxy-7-deazaguanine synthase